MPVLNIKKYTGPVALVPTCMYAPFYAKFIVANQRPPSSKHTRRMDLYDNKPQVHTPTLFCSAALPPRHHSEAAAVDRASSATAALAAGKRQNPSGSSGARRAPAQELWPWALDTLELP